jgi:hypothetical protein
MLDVINDAMFPQTGSGSNLHVLMVYRFEFQHPNQIIQIPYPSQPICNPHTSLFSFSAQIPEPIGAYSLIGCEDANINSSVLDF